MTAANDNAAIVAWLRADQTWKEAVNCTMAMSNRDTHNVCQWIASAIERGAHDTLADSDGDDGA